MAESSNTALEKLAKQEYKYGFVTDIDEERIPPGLNEVRWRNPESVFGHREEVRVDLQGARVIHLHRELSPPQEWEQAGSSVREFSRTYKVVLGTIIALATFAIYIGGAVYVFRGNRWTELRRPSTGACRVIPPTTTSHQFVSAASINLRSSPTRSSA